MKSTFVVTFDVDGETSGQAWMKLNLLLAKLFLPRYVVLTSIKEASNDAR